MHRLLACVTLGLATIAWAQPAPEVMAELDALHLHRDNPQSAQKLQALLEKTVAEHPRDYDVLYRASRYSFWLADAAPQKHPERVLHGKRAWDFGERAVAVRPQGAEGHYFAAISIGAYALGIGIIKALREGLETKFHKHLDVSIKASLEFERRGALVARARAYYEVPWPKRDLGKSETILRQVVAKHPTNLRAWLYLAETQLRRSQPRQAQESITHVLNGSLENDPPEARRIKGLAQWVNAQIEKELK